MSHELLGVLQLVWFHDARYQVVSQVLLGVHVDYRFMVGSSVNSWYSLCSSGILVIPSRFKVSSVTVLAMYGGG